MSGLAGVVSRRQGIHPAPSWAEEIRVALSRHERERIESYADDSALLYKMDTGAYLHRALHRDPSGSVSMLAGEPLLCEGGPGAGSSRARDLEIIHHALDAGSVDVLRAAQGMFAAVYYRPSSRTLYLIADKLGLRPLYYWTDDNWIVYASALRVLEALSFTPKVMNVRAVTEIVAFGYPLGTRTPYDGIRTIRAAEVVSFDGGGLSSRQYWRWDAIPVSRRPESELLRQVHDRFQVAVRRRLHSDQSVLAFLSGGLDSRCVVAALSTEGRRVHTMSFGPPGTQDRVYSARIARLLGTDHHEDDSSLAEPGAFPKVAEIAGAVSRSAVPAVERPLLIWSGDGGSVGLGHVYMRRNTVELLRRGDVEGAVREVLLRERTRLVGGLLRRDVRRALSGTLREGIREELADIECEDPGRRMYWFLMLNDQRRHLARIPEDLDLYRFEYIAPFFDSDLLAAVAAVPLGDCLHHRFYNRLLELFPPAVLSVPWQVYPGHEAGPVPQIPGLASQFDRDRERQLTGRKAQLLGDTLALLRSDSFPEPVLSRVRLQVAYRSCRWGLRDYSYALEAALVYGHFWRTSGGRHSLGVG